MSRTPTRSLARRAGAVLATAVVGVSLVGASAAHAVPSGGGGPAKKNCSLKVRDPSTGHTGVKTLADGTKITVTSGGETATFRCDDGSWTQELDVHGGGRTLPLALSSHALLHVVQ
jgi:hypothetical protein